jgi:hypothetical protein
MEETDRVGERIFDQHALSVAGQQRLGGSALLIGEQDGRFLVAEVKVAIFAAGGCDPASVLSEADPMNFAPRVKIPVLLIQRSLRFRLLMETCQEPLLRALGPPDADKNVSSTILATPRRSCP